MVDASIGCYLGSFDPPHFGHLALARAMLEEVDSLVLLVPTSHFHKHPVFPKNATFEQRLAMLEAIRAETGLPIHTGLTDVVLFAPVYYGAYDYCADFYWDGVVNLSDLVILAQHMNHACPP